MTARPPFPTIPAVAEILSRRPHALVRWGMAAVALLSLAMFVLLARVELATTLRAAILVGESDGDRRRSEVSFLVAPDAALAARIPAGLFLGTSSWSFPGWADIVYDRRVSAEELARGGLRAYSTLGPFRTVCVDRGFYATPQSVAITTNTAGALPSTPVGRTR